MQTSTLKDYWHIFYHTFIATSLGIILQLTDTYFISQIGEKELAGMGLAMSFSIFVWAFLGSIVGSSMVNISKSYGAKQINRLKSKIFVGTIFAMVAAIPLYLIMHFGSSILFKIFNAEAEVIGHMSDYYHIWIIIILFYPPAAMYSGTMNKINLNKFTTIIMSAAILLNMVLDYLFIFGADGIIEPMGIKGAAWATVISSIVGTVLYWHALHSRGFIIYKLDMNKFLVISKRLFKLTKHYLVTGLAMPTAYLSITAGVSYLPTNVIAAYSLVDRMWLLYAFIMGAAGSAMGTLVTRYEGARQPKLGYEVFLFTQKVEITWLLSLLVVNFFFGKALAGVFLSNPESIEIFQYAWYVMILYWGVWGLQGTINSLFMSLGKPHLGTKTILVRNIGLTIFPFIGAKLYGLDAFLFSQVGVGALVLVWVLMLYSKHMKPYFTNQHA